MANEENTDILREILEELQSQSGKENEDKKKKEKEEKEKKKVLNAQAAKLAKGFPSVSHAVTKGAQVVEAAVKKSFEIQKTALSRGLNLGKIMDRAAQAQSLAGAAITGSTQALEVEMEKVAAGLGKQGASTDKLAVFTKLTGGNSAKLLKGLAELNMGVGMSTEQSNSLSKTIMSMSQNYNMTTEELMTVVKGLEKNMPMMKILGIAPEIAEATTRLGAALGQEAGTLASDLMNAFTSAEGAILASQLGVSNERMALLNAEGDATQNTFRLVEKAGQQASNMYDQFLAQSGDKSIAFKAITDALGPAMAQSAITYKQLAEQAKQQGQSVSEFIAAAAKEKEIKDEFNNTLDNFISVAFKPLEEVIFFLAKGVTQITNFLMNNDFFRGFIQAVTTVTAAIIALRAAMLIRAAKEGATGFFDKLTSGKQAAEAVTGGAASTAAGGASAAKDMAGGGAGGGIGEMLSGLGKGIKDLGSGIGGAVQGFLEGIANGIAAFGKTAVLKGVLGIAAVGASLIPFAIALNLMKGVGFKTLIVLGAALLVFGAAAVGLGMLLTGPIAVAFAVGAAAMGVLGIALVPLAFALNLTAAPLTAFAKVLTAISKINVSSLLLLAPALLAISGGMIALSTGGAISGIISFFTGGSSPIDKLIELGKAAAHINELARGLFGLGEGLDKVSGAADKLSDKQVDKISKIAKTPRKSPVIDPPKQSEAKPDIQFKLRQAEQQVKLDKARLEEIKNKKFRNETGMGSKASTIRMQQAQLRNSELMLKELQLLAGTADEQLQQQSRDATAILRGMAENSPLNPGPVNGAIR